MSFLFSMFGKGNKEELSKYDRISFKINLSEHIPQYYEATSNKAITQSQITPDHPLYYQIFPKKDEPKKDDGYIEYIAKDNDTMPGLAIRLDMNEQYLRNINSISGSLYPGMIVKLPKDTDLSKLEENEKVQQTERLRISQLLNSQKPANNINYKYTVYYFVGPSGDIKGVLTVNNNYIIFNPDLENAENLSKFSVEKLLKFNVLVQIADIQKAENMRLPQIDQFSSDGAPSFTNIVQFMLYKVGNIKIQRKYKQRLKQLKQNHKAIASISFSFREQNQALSQKQCNQVTQIINNIIDGIPENEEEDENKKRLTNIPFFDIINEKMAMVESQKSLDSDKESTHILTKSAILGTLTDESNIINQTQFENLNKKFPTLYKLYNWQKVYSARKDGSAFNTFLNKSRNVQPALFFIKQYKGNILGALIVESLEVGKTGRGQMLIFTFRGQSLEPQIYEWTGKNDFFVYLQKQQGLGIGMGLQYGIFMNRNLQKGSSAPTNTFGNKQKLSQKEDFHIDDVELWGVDNNF